MIRHTIAIVSANFAGIDNKAAHEAIKQNTGHILNFYNFTEDNFPSRSENMGPRLLGKIPKMLAWEIIPAHDYYIWMDGAFEITSSDFINFVIERIGSSDLLLFKHHKRNSIRSELQFMQDEMRKGNSYLLERYKNEPMEMQVESYMLDRTFNDNHLFIGGCFMYSNNLFMNRERNILREWFYHCARYSVQDQLSLPYLLHLFKIVPAIVTDNVFKIPHLRYIKH